MRIEELKKVQPYNVRLIFQEIDCDNDCVFIDPIGLSKLYLSLSNAANRVTPISTPSEPPTLVGPAPKHDPCRLFRKGDKVRVVEWNGRNYYDRDHHTVLQTGCLAEIQDDEKDEQQEGYVSVIFKEYIRCVPPCYLELVTPVEEMEPYCVRKYSTFYAVEKRTNHKDRSAMYDMAFHPHAKEAAEAERDRLNAEYRKEQK